MKAAFSFLGLQNTSQQRDLIAALQAAGAFNVAEATRYLNLIPRKQPQTAENSVAPSSYAMLDPSRILTNSQVYQFRSGGDDNGVTKTGQILSERWNPIIHGDPLLVHERLDGSLFVADGHHRLDLAKRLNAAGNGPGNIAAQVLREADGYTALDVKIIAAYKNMAHGHFRPLDGARVFKEAYSGKVHTDLLPQLQMNKDNLRIAFSLSKLSDNALNSVENDAIPVEVAAELANRVSDAGRQESVLAIISQKLKQEYSLPAYGYEIAAPNESRSGFAGKIAAQRAQPNLRGMAI